MVVGGRELIDTLWNVNRKEYVIRLLYTLLGRQQGVEYDKVFYTDKDGVEHEVKKEEPYH